MSSGTTTLLCLKSYKKHFGVNFIREQNKKDFNKIAKKARDAAMIVPYPTAEDPLFPESTMFSLTPYLTGVVMEHLSGALEEVDKDIKNQIQVLQQTYNELLRMHDVIAPQIIKMSKELRGKRLSLTLDIKNSLSLMKEIRQFFMEKDHEIEINRVKDFLSVCEKIKTFTEDGTMDAITEVMLKLEGEK